MSTSTLVKESTLRVHFWNLSAYVNGHLIGDWVDLDQWEYFEDFEREVRIVCQTENEIMVSDFESDFDLKIPQFTRLETIWELHEKLSEIEEYNREAFADYLEYLGGIDQLDTASSQFEDRYRGQYKDMEDFAWSFTEEVSDHGLPNIPGFIITVDVVAWEQDFYISDNGHVFWNY